MRRGIFYVFIIVLLAFIVLNHFDFFRKNDFDKIEEVMIKFKRGINQNSPVVMDSVCVKGVAEMILDEIYGEKKIARPEITGEIITLVTSKEKGHGAEVDFRLKDEIDNTIPAYSVKLHLKEKSGKWRIENYEVK